MKGTPGVITFHSQESDSIYAFLRGDNDRLYVCYWNAAESSWLWADMGQPLNARVNSSPAVVAPYGLVPPISRIHAFVLGDDAHLYERYWDGAQWVDWADRGIPNVATPGLSPGAVALASVARSILHVFCFSGDEAGSYLFRYSPEFSQWFFQGPTLTGADVVSEPGAILIPNWDSVYTYVVGNNGHLHVVHNAATSSTPVAPFWRDLGAPATGTLSWSKPTVSLFAHDLTYQLFSFFSGSEGHLWANIWGGANDLTPGSWVDLGTPEGTTVKNAANVVNFRFMDKDFMYTFVQGVNDHLYVFRWDGANDRLWADLGQPQTWGRDVPATPQSGNTQVSSPPGAVPFRFVEPNQTTDRMYAFVFGADNHLHVCYWNGVDSWLWNDLGPHPLPYAAIRGDYTIAGAQLPDNRADIPLLISKLKEIGANHFMHLIWNRDNARWPYGWEDFQLLAPQFQANGLSLWAYLAPPSEPPAPDPFAYDYGRWGEDVARIARDFPCVQGIVIDDFNGNTDLFTVSFVSEIVRRARDIHPGFQFYATSYYGRTEIFQEHVVQGVLDGLVFAYFLEHKDHTTTSTLRPQIEELRRWLDANSPGKRIKLVVMIYASKHSEAPSDPEPWYVRDCLEIVCQATQEGLADGAVTYLLPKANQNFLEAVEQVYLSWRP